MQQHAYSLGLQSHPEKGLHSFPGLPIPSKRSLVDSEELQSYTPLPIWGNNSLGEELVRGDNPLLGVIMPQDSER